MFVYLQRSGIIIFVRTSQVLILLFVTVVHIIIVRAIIKYPIMLQIMVHVQISRDPVYILLSPIGERLLERIAAVDLHVLRACIGVIRIFHTCRNPLLGSIGQCKIMKVIITHVDGIGIAEHAIPAV